MGRVVPLIAYGTRSESFHSLANKVCIVAAQAINRLSSSLHDNNAILQTIALLASPTLLLCSAIVHKRRAVQRDPARGAPDNARHRKHGSALRVCN